MASLNCPLAGRARVSNDFGISREVCDVLTPYVIFCGLASGKEHRTLARRILTDTHNAE